MSFIRIYITNEPEAAAEQLASYLIENKLAACANIYPMKSIYWWKGKIQKESEWVALVKTTKELWPKIKGAIEEQHPYEVPCIMKIEVEANEAYEAWIRKSVS
ncbi:MAG: divalent-cation tolerance protein CutA [Saprospiraceae bacterium]